MTIPKQDLADNLVNHGQDHLLRFAEQLTTKQCERLHAQIAQIDFPLLSRLAAGDESDTDWHALAKRAESPPAFRLESSENRFSESDAIAAGQQQLAAGKVGAILVAGGQGTRLGFPHPKGMYEIGPVSGASLFQILLEKVLASGRTFGTIVPLYVMTSPATHDETIAYFKQHNFFGLSEQDVAFFSQGTMPAIDARSGKLLLEEPGKLALSPDGHGGMLAAMARDGLLNDAGNRGLEQLFYFQVDNPLAKVCDPELVGYHLLSGSEMSTQVVSKTDPTEKVGVVVCDDGKVQIIEYSDLPDECAAERNDEGSLKHWAGSIAVHVFDVEFLDRAARQADSLPFHIAQKIVPFVDSEGKRCEPTETNALKFERFIFDLLPLAKNAIVVEVDPRDAFAPLKNRSGETRDTPESVRTQISALHTAWLRESGASVDEGVPVEISPLLALTEEQLREKLDKNLTINQPTYLK